MYSVQEVNLKNADTFRNVLKNNLEDNIEYSLKNKSELERVSKEGA